MIRTDAHLHTDFSEDSDASMESMVERAVALGMKTICFTEHYDHDFPENPGGWTFSLDFEKYFDKISSMQEKYAGKIEILCGIELGVQPHLGDDLHTFYRKMGNRFDFILNSCHLVDRIDPYDAIYFETHPAKEGLRLYFEEIYKNLRAYPYYQSAGHLDYAARYMKAPRPAFHYADYAEILDEILLLLIREDKSLEVNTAGLKAGLPWPNPHMEILKRYRALGGERITIGSDGHCPEHLAYAFDRLPEILSAAGFTRYCLYRKQEPEYIPVV